MVDPPAPPVKSLILRHEQAPKWSGNPRDRHIRVPQMWWNWKCDFPNITKHFTLDKTMDGPDHKASLEPEELKAMVSAIRNTGKALGVSEKKPSPSENVNVEIVWKSIVASQNIKKGEILTEENITTKRPGNGISPMKWDDVIGSIAVKSYCRDDSIWIRLDYCG